MTASLIGPTVLTLCTTLAALGGIIALILLAARLAQRRLLAIPHRLRMLGPSARPRLSLTETLALDPRRRLYLLECDGARILLLTGGPSDLLLSLGQVA